MVKLTTFFGQKINVKNSLRINFNNFIYFNVLKNNFHLAQPLIK